MTTEDVHTPFVRRGPEGGFGTAGRREGVLLRFLPWQELTVATLSLREAGASSDRAPKGHQDSYYRQASKPRCARNSSAMAPVHFMHNALRALATRDQPLAIGWPTTRRGISRQGDARGIAAQQLPK